MLKHKNKKPKDAPVPDSPPAAEPAAEIAPEAMAKSVLRVEEERKDGFLARLDALPPVWGATLAAAGLLALYLTTLSPSVDIHDAGELAAASYTLGVAHPAGSPLFCVAGKAFATLLPFGSVVFRYSLFSALCGALAAAGVYLFARRLGAGALLALAGALTLGTSLVF